MILLTPFLLAASPDPTLMAALQSAVTRRDARIELVAASQSPNSICRPETWTALRPIETSGVVPFRISGRDRSGHPCLAALHVTVRLFAPVAVVQAATPAGAEVPVALEERELMPGRSCLAEVGGSARARRMLRAGECIEPQALEFGPRPGSPVLVRLTVGTLAVERSGRALSSSRGEGAAELDEGRRVTGRWDGNTLEVASP